MFRRTTDITSRYNRALAFHIHDGAKVGVSALDAMATNEVQLIFLLVKWAGCTETGYSAAGLKIAPEGAFARVTHKQVQRALRDML